MTSIVRSNSAARRRAVAVLLLAFFLLSTSCEKKAAVMYDRVALSKSSTSRGILGYSTPASSGGGGGREDYDKSPDSANVVLASLGQPDTLDARKIIRNGSLELLVNDVSRSVERIGSLATAAGGFVEKSTQTNSGSHAASVTLRIPAAHLDQVIAQIKALATTVDR